METYKKIDDETIEITTTYKNQVKKTELEEERKHLLDEQTET